MGNIRSYIEALGNILEEIERDFDEQRGTLQSEIDLSVGNFRMPSGILIPYQVHRFVYENYDLFLFRAYVKLFRHMIIAENEIFISTTFRIQQELGINKIDIFFSDVLTADEKKKMALVLILSDWLMLTGDEKYKTYFQKLFKEEKQRLDKDGLKFFRDMDAHIVAHKEDIPTALLKTIKSYRNRLLRECSRKISGLSFIKEPNLERLYSFWSELMHGNPFMLEQVFNQKLACHTKNRLYAILWFTGQHVLLRMEPLVENPDLKKRIVEICSESESVWKRLSNDWETKKQKGLSKTS